MKRPEPVQVIKKRRDAALQDMVASVPYIAYLGVKFERRGDELTGILPYRDDLIGNPMLPALHGGVTAAFLEMTAIITLAWEQQWADMEKNGAADFQIEERAPRLPKTIDITIDYLRTGLPRDAYARARVVRSGRRYASVQVEAWQDNRTRPFAHASCHFLMPSQDG